MEGSDDPLGGQSSTTTPGTSTGGLSHLPWTQIPSFRPGETDIHEYSRKLEFLAGLWPAEHLSLLAPRAAMLCEGSAFQRVMRVEASKLKANSLDGVKALVTALGGIWGKTSLEDRFERFERAVYTTVQRGDETHESYLARHDHQFETLLSSGVNMEQLRAYILLRNSGLAAEDKKKLIIDSGGMLAYDEVVKSLKLLGSKFFQEVHAGTKNPSRSRTYDINMTMDEEVNVVAGAQSGGEETILVSETDESYIEALAEEGDPDALICQQFEDAVLEVLQNDTETASCYFTYVEARRRLTDRNRNRGFWSPGASQPNAKGAKGRGKGKFAFRSRKPLAARILESECRRCGQRGHWKAECPLRNVGNNATVANQTKENATFTTLTMTAEPNDPDSSDMILMTEMDVTHDEGCNNFGCSVADCFVINNEKKKHTVISQQLRQMAQRLKLLLKQRLMPDRSPQPVPRTVKIDSSCDTSPEVACFASHGSFGIVDLGASQSVIGQRQLNQVLESLDPEIRKQVRETSCDTVFRFGNSSTVRCQRAMLIPLGKWFVKLCIVPSDTPFLLSNNMFRTLGAQIDTASDRVFLPGVNLSMDLSLTEKKLYLLDFGKLVNMSFQRDDETGNPGKPQVDNVMLTEKLSEITMNQVSHSVEPLQSVSHSNQVCQNMSCKQPGTSQTVVDCPRTFDPTETVSNASCRLRDPAQGKPCREIPPSDGSQPTVLGGPRLYQDDTGRTGTECDHVWGSQEGSDLHESGSGRSELCDVVHQQVQQQSEVRASPFLVVHPDVCRSSREPSEHHQSQKSCRSEGSSSNDGQSPGRIDNSPRSVRGRVVDVGCHRRTTSSDQPTGEPAGPTHLPPGGRVGTGCRPTSRTDSPSEGRRGSVGPSVETTASAEDSTSSQPASASDRNPEDVFQECIDVEFFQDCLLANQVPDNHVFQEMWSYWCKRFNISDPQTIRRHFAQPGVDLLEVYCSQDSQLTKQCVSQGLSAMRFSLKHGDLNTSSGRHVLYDMLWQLRPKHIWVAPTCKPWCCWSRLNAAKSESLAQKICQERQGESVHLLLCDALLHLQLWRNDDCHFHLEQPQGSDLVHQREMYVVNQHTRKALCDMCTAGRLHHPETSHLLRKRTQILTTSDIMYRTLEKLQCDGLHVHDTIQGGCKPKGLNRMPLTKYTELYTATFGRKLSRVIQCSLQAREKQCVPFQSEDSGILHAIACAARESDSRDNHDQSTGKRRRLGTKSHPNAIHVPDEQQQKLETAIKTIETQTPRVGKVVFQDGEILRLTQELFPDMHVKVIEACRGVDRRRDLPIAAPSHLLPYRRTFGKDRSEQKIYCDGEWEKWDKLSKRQIRRPGTPSKIAITVFANKKVQNETTSTDPNNTFQFSKNTRDRSPLTEEQPIKKVRLAEPHVDKSPAETVELQMEQPLPSELTCPKTSESQKSMPTHGPMFRGLSPQVQQMIVKIHKNLGHPDMRQLQHALKRSGWSDLVIQAVQDFQCDVCFEKSLPKAPRPAHIHVPREFNDLVVFDGVDWSDGQGNKYSFVHFLDTATNFQIAVPFFRQSTEEFMGCFRNAWIRWAGAPREVMFDSQTGFNSELFGRFLQEQSIRSHVIPTGAHWQMGRCERHGGILLRMLDKFHVDQPISNWQEFEIALQMLCNAKNSLSRHAGFTPEILVLGKSQHIPGSNTDDTDSAGFLGMDDMSPDGARFAQQLARREAARVAFVKADHCQALKKAIHARSRPDRMQFTIGDHVMYWKQGKGAEPGSWHGPARIIMIEQPNTVWISHLTRLYRCAPEHIRSVSSREISRFDCCRKHP